ncbi:CocE/NonD family hydrolase [bacterium]|nr:CocE/NonD family hydrolase [bacterium]
MANPKPQPLLFLLLFFALFSPVMAYTVRSEMVPMRDNIRLATDIYQPVTSKPPWPVILLRTPYNKSSAMDPTVALLVCNFMHYAIVVQNTRGRYQSEGIDSLYFSDGWGVIQDGFDTVSWLETQSWCNGRIGTWGASALGITQYLLAGSAPPGLDCCVVMVAASNLYEDALFYDGVYRESMVDGWLGGNQAGHLIDFFSEHPMYEPMYDRLNLMTRLNAVQVPVLHVGGWHDIFIQGQINAFQGLQEQGGAGARGRQKIVIGPWEHDIAKDTCGELRFPNSSSLSWLGVMLDWFDFYLKDTDEPQPDMPAVRYYLMGDADSPGGPGNRWIQSDTWPPYTSVPFYFHSEGLLSLAIPPEQDSPDAFVFDPEDPVPTAGGRNLNIPAGSRDQRSVEEREDVLVYTTEPLMDSLVITGPVYVTLFACSDATDTDFTAKLCDVYPDGRSMLVADGAVRARHRNSLSEENFLNPGEIAEFTIDLWSTALAFAPGHCIRVDISSSNSPRFAVNPNTGEPFRKETSSRIANQTVFHDAGMASALMLPVVGTVPACVEITGTSAMPGCAALLPCSPNPFNGTTAISVRIPAAVNRTRLHIVDIRGRLVKSWHLSDRTGEVRLLWNGEDNEGREVPSGVYIVCLPDELKQRTQKVILLQ